MRPLKKQNFLIQFSAISLVVMAVIAVILAAVISHKIQSDALNAVATEAAASASGRVLTAITAADLEAPMTGMRYDKFHEFALQSLVSERTARVRLWAKDGTVIYSDDSAIVGAQFPANENLLKALRGETAREIKSPEAAENPRERYLGTLMEVYTPIIFPGSTEPQGALEIYQYYRPTAQRIDHLRRWIFGSIGVGFVILYFSIVWRAWRTISRQEAALGRTNADLHQANEELHKAQERLVLTLNETESRAEKLRALAELGRTVTATLDPQQVFDLIIRASSELLDGSVATVWTLEDEELFLRAQGGVQAEQQVHRRFRLGEGLTGLVAAQKQPVVIPEFVLDPRAKGKEWALAEDLHAFAGVPLLAGNRCLGVLAVIRRSPAPFKPDEVELLCAFADQAAVAVENAKLYDQLKEMTVLEERERIARDMHDGLAQQLGHLYLRIGSLEANPCIAPVEEEVRLIRKEAAAAYDEVRQAIVGLKTVVSRGLGLIPTLTEYLHDFSEQTGVVVKLKIADEEATRLSAHSEVQLIRIIQEALANVRKHAHAKRAWVTFDREEGNAKVTVQDDGRGFDPGEVLRFGQASFGLQGIRERAELAAGRLTVESEPGKGTQLIVWLPMAEE